MVAARIHEDSRPMRFSVARDARLRDEQQIVVESFVQSNGRKEMSILFGSHDDGHLPENII